MLRVLFLVCLISLSSEVNANNKDQIINKLKNTSNLNFDFEQNINGKIEFGNCTIQYPKKIYCKYIKNNKILVSNGKSLVIKTQTSFYRYPLNKKPLNLILDKKFLIENMGNLKEKTLDKNHISFEIEENDNEINIFFDNKTINTKKLIVPHKDWANRESVIIPLKYMKINRATCCSL